MRALVFGIILSMVVVSSGFAFADSTYQMKGSGAAMINSDTPASVYFKHEAFHC